MDSHLNNEDIYEQPSAGDTLTDTVYNGISSQFRELSNFMNGLITNDKNCDIVKLGSGGKYKLTDGNFREFFTLAKACKDNDIIMHFAEKQRSRSGIMIDLDIKQSNSASYLNGDFYSTVCKIISDIIYHLFDFDQMIEDGEVEEQFEYRIFIIKKPNLMRVSHEDKLVYKDGVHILIPEIMVCKTLKLLIYKKLQEDYRFRKLLKDTIKSAVEDIDKIIDNHAAGVYSVYYGSCKEGNEPYVLEYSAKISYDVVADRPTNQISIDDVEELENSYNMIYELSLSYKNNIYVGDKDPLTNKREYNTLYLNQETTELHEELKESKKVVYKTDKETTTEELLLRLVTEKHHEAKILLALCDIIKPEIIDEYNPTLKLFCALANRNKDYKPIAFYYAEKYIENYNAQAAEELWNNICMQTHAKPITINSFHYWARLSDKDAYTKIVNNELVTDLVSYIFKNLGGMANRIPEGVLARILEKLLIDRIIITSGSAKEYNEVIKTNSRLKTIWWEFATSDDFHEKTSIWKWIPCESSQLFAYTMHYVLPNILNSSLVVIDDLRKQYEEDTDKKNKKKTIFDKAVSVVKTTIVGLQKIAVCNSIVTYAQSFLFKTDNNFKQKLDEYSNVIGVGNGVLITGKKAKLIDYPHDYRIMRHTKTRYVPYDKNNKYIKEVKSILKDIFNYDHTYKDRALLDENAVCYGDNDVYKFMLYHAATAVDLEEIQQMLFLIVGSGSNGKTWFTTMIKETLGSYVESAHPNVLLDKVENANSPNSAIMRLKNSSYIIFDEFDKCAVLQASRIKHITGGGEINAAEKFKANETFKLKGNIVACSNYDFIVQETDHGTWRRLLYYTAKIKFVDNPDPDNPFEKKKDPSHMKQKRTDPRYKEAVLSLLVHYNEKLHNRYKGDLFSVPHPTIMNETKTYRNRQDILSTFINSRIIVKIDITEGVGPEDTITADDLATKYIQWNRQRGGDAHIAISYVVGILLNSELNIYARQDPPPRFVGVRCLSSDNEEPVSGYELYKTSKERKDREIVAKRRRLGK